MATGAAGTSYPGFEPMAADAYRVPTFARMLDALTEYNAKLEAALGTAQDHVKEMSDTLDPGLQTLRSVVEQAEAFLPAQARGRA